jgi:hypothetical protein
MLSIAIFSFSDASLESSVDITDDNDPIAKENEITPTNMKNTATILAIVRYKLTYYSPIVPGVISPYPTVVMVIIVK